MKKNLFFVIITSRLIKKRVFLPLLLMMILPVTSVFAQVKSITFNLKNVKMDNVFEAIEKASALTFVYDSKIVDTDLLVSLKVEDKSVTEVLNKLFANKDIKYTIVNSQIILSEKQVQQVAKQGKHFVEGVVVDANGSPLLGATAILKGTTKGAITDVDGKFSIEADSKDGNIISITYLGYHPVEMAADNKKNMLITLREGDISLEEVVVIGYGTQRKENLTSSVGIVAAKDLQERPVTNVQSLLQGQVAGLQVTASSGVPGAAVDLQIRGMGSFSSAGSSPMVLVDGVAGSLNSISPSEIESISVLKDAASAAIYGARAANGVILITTKKGSDGRMQVSYAFNGGWQKATVLPDLVTSSVEYMEMYNQMADRVPGKKRYDESYIDMYRDPNRDLNQYPDYDWVNNSFNTAFIQNHSINATGGNEKMNYNVNFSYLDQDGVLSGFGYKRYTGRANLEAKVHKSVTIGTRVSFSNSNTASPAYGQEEIMLQMAQQRPMYAPYLPDGSGRYTYIDRPLSEAGEFTNRSSEYIMNETSSLTELWRWDAQAYMDVQLLKTKNSDLKWNSKAALNSVNSFVKTRASVADEGFYFHPIDGEYVNGTNFNAAGHQGVKDTYSNSELVTVYSTLDYKLSLDKHSFGAMAGYNHEIASGRVLSIL